MMGAVCANVARAVRCAAEEQGEPCVLVGYSMGGRIALETLVRYGACPTPTPTRSQELPLAALVLESAGLGPRDTSQRAAFAQRNRQWAREVREQGIEAFMDAWERLPLFESQRALGHEVRARVRAERMGCSADELICMLEECGQHHQTDERTSLVALREAARAGVRVAYFAGELDAKYAAVARCVTREIPQACVRVIPQAGHNVHLEQPQAFSREITHVISGKIV